MADVSETLIAAHRGGAHLWAENSLHAFRQATGLPIGYIELDVHRTRDHILVVHHDSTIDRMTDGRGAIAEMTYDNLRRHVIVGSGGEPVPTLAEALAVIAPSRVDLRLELKTASDQRRYEGIESDVVAALRKADMLSRTLVTSFMLDTLVACRAAVSDASAQGYVWLVNPLVLSHISVYGAIAAARAHDIMALGFSAKILDAALVRRAWENGFAVHGWAAHSAGQAELMFGLGVASFTTDRPDIAVRVRDGLAE